MSTGWFLLIGYASALTPVLLAVGSKYGFSWGIILLTVALGLIVTLRSARRSIEIKRPTDE